MLMVVQCNHCGAANKARREDTGKRAKCRHCGTILVIREARRHAQQGHPTEGPRMQEGGYPPADHDNGSASSSGRDRAITPARTAAVRGDQRVQMRAAPATTRPQSSAQQGSGSPSSSDPCQRSPGLAKGEPQQARPFNPVLFVIFITLVVPTLRWYFSSRRPHRAPAVTKTDFSPGRLDSVPSLSETKQPTDWLPADGIYSAAEGSGGSHRDPIHGFFGLQPSLNGH